MMNTIDSFIAKAVKIHKMSYNYSRINTHNWIILKDNKGTVWINTKDGTISPSKYKLCQINNEFIICYTSLRPSNVEVYSVNTHEANLASAQGLREVKHVLPSNSKYGDKLRAMEGQSSIVVCDVVDVGWRKNMIINSNGRRSLIQYDPKLEFERNADGTITFNVKTFKYKFTVGQDLKPLSGIEVGKWYKYI